MNTDAYPLSWPNGWPRTARPASARFDTSFAAARDALMSELRLLGARNIVLSSNQELRRDGLPYANRPQPFDRGVAVYFEREEKPQCIPCDKWSRIEDNVQAIRKTVEALRGLERWGAKSMVDAAFQGFLALPASSQAIQLAAWWEVLGVARDASKDDVRSAFKSLAMKHHPDQGGDAQRYMQIKSAYEQGMKE